MAIFLPKSHFYIVVSRCLCGMVFIWIGMFLIKKIQFIPKISGCLFVFFTFAVTVIVTVLNGKVSMNLCEYHNPILYIVGSVFGTIFILLISNKIHSKTLSYIGKNSLIIMGTHLNIIVIIEKIYGVKELPFRLWIPVLLVVILLEIIFIQIYKCVVTKRIFGLG